MLLALNSSLAAGPDKGKETRRPERVAYDIKNEGRREGKKTEIKEKCSERQSVRKIWE